MPKLTARSLRNRVLTILDRHDDMQDARVTEEDNNRRFYAPAIRIAEGGRVFLITFEEVT